MTPARIAALLAEGYGPASALHVATTRFDRWARVLEAATDPAKLAHAAGRVTLWRTVAIRLATHHATGGAQ